jgi:CRP-like cAMP-binding protein
MQESPYLQDRDFLIERFKKLPLLKNLKGEYITDVLNHSKIKTYEPGEVIAREGEFDRWVFILISGAVEIGKNGEHLASINQIGDTFGEQAMIDEKARSATVSALDHTVCLALDVSSLNLTHMSDWSGYRAVFCQLFAEILSNRLRDTNEELLRTREELELYKKGIKTAAG